MLKFIIDFCFIFSFIDLNKTQDSYNLLINFFWIIKHNTCLLDLDYFIKSSHFQGLE